MRGRGLDRKLLILNASSESDIDIAFSTLADAFDTYARRTFEMLSRHWRAVEAVASALVERWRGP
jgi:hypothetical protein